jgi:hypothetical protein
MESELTRLLAALGPINWIRREAWSEDDIAYGTRLEAHGVSDQLWLVPPGQTGASAAPPTLDEFDEWSWRVEVIGMAGFMHDRIPADEVLAVVPGVWYDWALNLTEDAHRRLCCLLEETDDAEYAGYLADAETNLGAELARSDKPS